MQQQNISWFQILVAMGVGCRCLPARMRKNTKGEVTPPEIVKIMFNEATKGKNVMTAADFVVFLETVQGEKAMDAYKAAALITQTVLSAIAGFYFSISVQSVQLDLQGFLNYLVNSRLNPAFVTTEKVSLLQILHTRAT